MSDPSLLITLCTYNERENIERLIPQILQVVPHAEVLVIDDNSPDGTGAAADALAARDKRIHVLHRQRKEGLGAATMAGFRYAIEHGYDRVLNMDADFSHSPQFLPALLEASREADVAIGSRYVPGGGVHGWKWYRRWMSRAINAYARFFLGLKTRDNSGSFRCYRVSRLAEIDFDRIRARGYAFQEEILFHCRNCGCTFAEVPILFEDRRFGTSKINMKEAAIALWVIFRLGLSRLCPANHRHAGKRH